MKLIHIISVFTFAIAFILIILVGIWEVYPYKPLVITRQPMPVTPHTVSAGQQIHLEVDYCKNINLPTEVSRVFIDGLIYAAPTITTNNPLGCHSATALVLIPEGLPPGNYTIKQTFVYKVNPVRTVEIVAVSEPFIVQ